MNFAALRVLIVSERPPTLKQNAISPVLPARTGSRCVIHISETQRVAIANRVRLFHADIILCQLCLPYALSSYAIPALAQY